MTTDSAGPYDRSDADLIASVRAGRIEEYGTLYERHVEAAARLARQLCPTTADADDVVSESFAKVLDALRDGKGPDHAFRAYLLTTVRNTAYSRSRGSDRVRPTENLTAVGGVTEFTDPAVEELERSLVARAFRRLPERWQTVLWHTVIEQQSASEVAPLLGMSPNAVSALAYRARAGLRQEYLQAHLAETSSPRCRATANKLGAWTRDGLSLRERAQVEQHLDHCARCRALADELADINSSLRGVVAFLVLGGGALGYLAGGPTPPVAAATTATAGTTDTSTPETGPRHFLGVAVSGVALVTAVAVALAAGGVSGEPVAHRPQTAQPPRPAVSEPAPSSPTPEGPTELPSFPPLPAPQPRPDSYRPRPTVFPPPPLRPAPSEDSRPPAPSPTEPPSRPEPAPDPDEDPGLAPPTKAVSRPRVSASVPDDGLTVDAGGRATDLDVTVRNDGAVTAERTAVELTLPPGVSAVSPDDGTEVRTSAVSPVACPEGEGTVVCTVSDALAPDDQKVLRFRVAASPEADSGTARGRVTATGAAPARFTVPITVRRDVVELDVSSVGRLVRVTVRSAGVRAADASVSLDAPGLVLHSHRLRCDRGDHTLDCVSRSPLDPGDTARLWAHVPLLSGIDTVTVTATIGEDTASAGVDLVSLLAESVTPGTEDETTEDETTGPAPTSEAPVAETTSATPEADDAGSPIGSSPRERRRRPLGGRVRPCGSA